MQRPQEHELGEQGGQEQAAVQEQQEAYQDDLTPVQERGDPPQECSCPWVLLSPATTPDPHMADPPSSGDSSASQELGHRLQLCQQQIQMLLEKLAKAEQKAKLSEEQNLLLLKRREEDQAKNRYLLHKNDELTRRNEQLQVEVDQLQRERDQPRAQMARLSQQIEELLSARMFSPSQGHVDSARQGTLVEPGEELLSSSSSIMVHHGPPAFTALPLQSPDAPVSLQRGLGLPVQPGQDSSATNCKGQQDGGGVMRHKKSGPRHFTIEKHHHECATCGQFFKSELAAKQIPCAYHKKRAMKVPYQFWVQSPCSPGSMSSSQSREQNGQTPKLLFWPCCEQTGSKAKPCCSQHQHKLIAPNCKS